MTDVASQPGSLPFDPNGPGAPPAPTLGAPGAPQPGTTPVQPTTAPTGITSSAGTTLNSPATKLQAATRAGPKLDPKTTVAVANTATSPTEAASNAQVVQIFRAATKLGDVLSTQPARAQAAFWDRASKPMRDLLDAAGYKPPQAPPQDPSQPVHRGVLGSIWHDVAHGFDEARHGGATAGSWLVHKPLHYVSDVANVGMDQITHTIRAATELSDTNDLAYQQGHQSLGQDVSALFSPSQWIRAWHATQNGSASFQPQVIRYLRRQLTPAQLTVAKHLAAGESLQAVLQKVPEAERAAMYQTIETDPTFHSALSLLSDSHLTLGQSIFGGLSNAQLRTIAPHAHDLGAYSEAGGALGGALVGGMRGGPGGALAGAAAGGGVEAAANALGTTPDQLTTVSPFGLQVHPLSGIVDGVVDWYDSPLVIGTSMHAANTARRFAILDGLGNARDVRALYQTDPAVQRGMDAIARAITTPEAGAEGHLAETANVAQVIRVFPKLNPLAEDLVHAYPAIKAAQEDGLGGEAVADFFASEQALINLARGRAGLFFHKATMFPHLTVPQALALSTKTSLADLLRAANGADLDRVSPRQWMRSVFGERAAAAAPEKAPGPAARFARRAVTLTPAKDYIDLSDPDRAAVFHRYAEMFLPPDQASRLTNAFMQIPSTDEGRQIAMIHALQDELFAAAGLDESMAGQRYVEDWQRRRSLGLEGEHYSFGNNAFYANPGSDETGVGREHAILPSQLSSAIAMPRFQDLYRLAKKSWAFEKLGAVLDPSRFDRLMGLWKGYLLARPGFGLRVAGEELFGAALREGALSLTQTRIAASLLGLESPVTPALRRWLPRAIQALTGHVPSEALREVKTLEDLEATVYGWRTIHFLRKAGLTFVPKEILDAAMWRAVHGQFSGPLAESIDALTQHAGGLLTDSAEGWTEAVRRWDGADAVRMAPTGKMARHGRLDEDAYPAYHYALSGIAMDAPVRAAAGALLDDSGTPVYRYDFVAGRELTGHEPAGAHYTFEKHSIYEKSMGKHLTERRIGEPRHPLRFHPISDRPPEKLASSGLEMALYHLDRPEYDRIMAMSDDEAMAELERLGIPENAVWRAQPYLVDVAGARAARAAGHDAVVVRGRPGDGTEGSDEFVALHPSALRSPTTQERQVAAVLRWMQDPANEALVNRFAVSGMTPDGRLVATGEASKDEALRAWAEKIVAHVNHYLLSSEDGAPIRLADSSLAERIATGEVPSTAELEQIDRHHLPDEIVARELLPKLEGGLQRILEKGMQQMVGRPLNYLSRMPVFHLHFATAFKEAKQLVEALGMHDEGDELAGDIASERAWRETMPYLHNPRVRSQMSVIHRNLAPFWFAQEQFYKRWAMTFAKYPEAFRKAELLMNGLRSVGFVQKDAYGQDAFVYPGSAFVTGFLAHVFGASLPVANAFTSEISQLNPSFATGGIVSFPSPGPFVSIPLETLNAALPELDPFTRAVMGPMSPQEDHQQPFAVQVMEEALGQTMPTIVQRMIPVLWSSTSPADPAYSTILARSMVQAAQYLEASGHGPTVTEDPAQVDIWQQRLSNWARNMLLFRAAFGFASPASPSFSIQGTALGQELDALMATLPYDQAVAAFLKVHPDATPYTIFESTTGNVGQSGAYVPSTQAALDFIDAHKPFFDRYPAAAPWLFPLSDGKGQFNDQAYLAELSMGLRARRDFGSWWQDVRYAEAANVYFPLEAKVKAAEVANPAAKSQIQHAWDVWVAAFKRVNPIFATRINEPTASNRRMLVIQQMQQALADGALPKSPQAEHLALLMAGFQKVQDYYDQTQGESSASTQHTANKKAFLAWGADVATTYPDVSAFWAGILSREVPG